MATTIFNNLILATARRLKDVRATADSTSDAGKRYSSALLAEYMNRSIRDFLIDSYQKYGEKAFTELFPQYIVTGTGIALFAGVGAKPSDCFGILDLRQGNIKFRKIRQDAVESVITGIDKVIVPTATIPIFYEEGNNFYTLGITTSSVIPRYIQTHQDISPTIAVAGVVRVATSVNSSTFVPSNLTLASVTISPVFSAADIGKTIVIKDINGVFIETITSIISGSSVLITNTGGMILDTPGDISEIYVSANSQVVTNDLILNQYWHGEIVERAVALATKDTKAFNS